MNFFCHAIPTIDAAREDAWRQTMEARDEALRTLRARLETAETELARLQLRSQGEDERTLVGTLDAQQRIESAQKALALAEARHVEERQALADAMQNLRERIAAETARARTAEQRWQAREQQYLIDARAYAPDIATLGTNLPADVSAYYTIQICRTTVPCNPPGGTPPTFAIIATPIAGAQPDLEVQDLATLVTLSGAA